MADIKRCPTCAKPLGDTLSDRIIRVIAETMAVTGQPLTYSFLRAQTGSSPQGMVNALGRLKHRGSIEKVAMGNLAGWTLTEHALEELVEPEERGIIQLKAAKQAQEAIEAAGDLKAVLVDLLERIRGSWSVGRPTSEADARAFLVQRYGVGDSTAEEVLLTSFIPNSPVELDPVTGEISPTGAGWWSEMRAERDA